MKSKPNFNSQIPNTQITSNLQKSQAAIKSDDLFKLFILDNNNPKFKAMYQNLQTDGIVVTNLQHEGLKGNKVMLLAPYEIK